MRAILTATALGFLAGTAIAGWVMGLFVACAAGAVAGAGFIVLSELTAKRY